MDPLEFTPWHQLAPRAIAGDVRDTFSSWDKCMAKNYCKWPAIVGIAVGGIILLSVIWCLVGCLCCGYTCCKGCCECCSCCCPSSSRKAGPSSSYTGRSKFADETPYSGYQRPAPPVYQQPVNTAATTPSYAQFDTPGSRQGPTGGRANDDALPNMPTWQDSTTRRVEDTSRRDDEMEMTHLNPVTGHSVVDDGAGGAGYYHRVSSQPPSPLYGDRASHQSSAHMTGAGYRGTDPISPTHASAIGIAHSPGYGQAPSNTYLDSQQTTGQVYSPPRYQTQSPSTIRGPSAGDPYGYAETRSFTRSPVQRTRATPSPRPPLSPIQPYSPERAGLPYPSQPYSPVQTPQQPQRTYTPYSPSTSTPPPPWSSTDQPRDAEGQSQPQRAPSLLMAGRKPVENSWRDV
ncbi:hypothetical protein MferCBS31731_005874 [Microsporum ferrugineum]